jgi:hypothetical protein
VCLYLTKAAARARNTLALIKELGDRPPSRTIELKTEYGSIHGALGSQLGVDLSNPLAIEEQVQIQKVCLLLFTIV